MNKKTLQITVLLLAATTVPLYCGKGKREKNDQNQPEITRYFAKKLTGSVQKPSQLSSREISAVARIVRRNPHALDDLLGKDNTTQTQQKQSSRQNLGPASVVRVEPTPLTQSQQLKLEQSFWQRKVDNWGRDYEPDTTMADMAILSEIEEQIRQIKKQ